MISNMALTIRTLNIISLRIASLLLLLLGICLVANGVFMLLKYRSNDLFFSHFYTVLPALFAVISGVLLLSSGTIGCMSSNDSCLQALFMYFLIVVCCVVSTAGVLACLHTDKLDMDLAPFKDVFQTYSGNSQDPDTRAVNALQSELQCCGVNNYTDWLDTPWFNHSGKYEVPQSCCSKTFHTCNGTLDLPALLYTEGCLNKFKEELLLVLKLIILGSFVVILVLIFSGVSVGHLMRHHPPQEYQILDQQ